MYAMAMGRRENRRFCEWACGEEKLVILREGRERTEFMAVKREFTFGSADGRTRIHGVRWEPEGAGVAGVVQIFHGMVEFIDRYEEFAQFLAERGFVVTGNDHLGHGGSIVSREDYGFFSEKDGNRTVLKDVHHLKRMTEKLYPNVPYFIVGHSMGSFLLRQYLCMYGKELKGAVIVGTGTKPAAVLKAGRALCRAEAALHGWRYRSPLIDKMAFAGYNKHFKPARTGSEWLTKDTAVVERYVSDGRCTFRFTVNGFYNLFFSIGQASKESNLRKMPRDLPILFASGKEDPVGNYGKGVGQVYRRFLAAGMKKVSLRLYEADRHEILNETDRAVVYEDIYRWLRAHLRGPQRKKEENSLL